MPDANQRMALYKRASQLRAASEAAALAEEIRDRYGAPPPEVEALLDYAAARLSAEALRVTQVDLVPGRALALRFAEDTPLPPSALVDLLRGRPGASVAPDGLLRIGETWVRR